MQRLNVPEAESFLVEPDDQLPNIDGQEISVDVETTSGHPNKTAFHPFDGARICGVAVATKDTAWYVPVRHQVTSSHCTDYRKVMHWLTAQSHTSPLWTGWNFKFDLKFLRADGCIPVCPVEDTMSATKLVDENRFDYQLKSVTAEVLSFPKDDQDRVTEWLRNAKSKDYGEVPVDIMALYACRDVIRDRRMKEWVDKKLDVDVKQVRDTERVITRMLFEMEWTGIRVDVPYLKLMEFKLFAEILDHDQELTKLIGAEFNPESDDQVADVVVNMLNLEVPYKTKHGNVSVNDAALNWWLNNAKDEKTTRFMQLMILRREKSHLLTAFVRPYLQLNCSGILHGNFNQIIRTGRMSMREPNLQQVPILAKQFFIPRDGNALIESDLSQIEYRVFAHYCNDPNITKAYTDNPLMDYHQWCADVLSITRKQAKGVNFGILYRMGVDKLLWSLQIGAGKTVTREEAQQKLNFYYTQVPRLRPLQYECERACARRGYIFNLYGRRRHLSGKQCYKAMNALIQGCAADVLKDMMASMWENRFFEKQLTALVCVHDSLLFEVPKELTSDAVPTIQQAMETTSVPFRVPIRANVEVHQKNWGGTDVKLV